MFNLHTMQIQYITRRCGLKERALILDVIYIMLGEPQLFGNVITTTKYGTKTKSGDKQLCRRHQYCQ